MNILIKITVGEILTLRECGNKGRRKKGRKEREGGGKKEGRSKDLWKLLAL